MCSVKKKVSAIDMHVCKKKKAKRDLSATKYDDARFWFGKLMTVGSFSRLLQRFLSTSRESDFILSV